MEILRRTISWFFIDFVFCCLQFLRTDNLYTTFEKLLKTIKYLFNFSGAPRSISPMAVAFEELYLVDRIIKMHNNDILPINSVELRV